MSELDNYIEKTYKAALSFLREAAFKVDVSAMSEMEKDQLFGFLAKLFLQANTAIIIGKGTPIKLEGFEKTEIDKVSMLILARNAIETYAQFFHIFVAPKNNDIKNFRLLMSEYRGLRNIKDIRPREEPQITLAANNRTKSKKLLSEIYKTQHYQDLKIDKTPKQLKQYEKDVKEGVFEEFGKTKFLKEAGVSETTANILYNYQSDFTHSGSISLKQITPSSLYQPIDQTVNSILHLFFIPVVFTLKGLSKAFPEVQKFFEEKPGELGAIYNFISNFNKIFTTKPNTTKVFLRRKLWIKGINTKRTAAIKTLTIK